MRLLQVLHAAHVSLAVPAIAAAPVRTAHKPPVKKRTLMPKNILTHTRVKTATGTDIVGLGVSGAPRFTGTVYVLHAFQKKRRLVPEEENHEQENDTRSEAEACSRISALPNAEEHLVMAASA